MVSRNFCAGTILFVALAAACTDDPDFEDEDGYSCEDWLGYDCDDALSWGLSEEGKQDLLDSCCKSCNPPEITYPEGEECQDNDDFEDVKGYGCSDWEGYACEFWNGYSNEDMQDVRDNCCKTCKTHCVDNWRYLDEQEYRCGDWKGYDCRKAVEEWDYSQEGQDKLQKECCDTCSAYIVAEGCEDNEDFEDEQGYPCEDWEGYSCITAAELEGYTEKGEQDVLDNCCRTCTASCVDSYWFTDAKGYECKEWAGYDCNTAADEWEYSEDEQHDILDNCCKTCSAFEADDPSGGESDDSEGGDDEGEGEAGPLDFSAYVAWCEDNSDDEETCKASGCKYKKKKGKTQCIGPKAAKKVKCKKVKSESVCNRLGCDLKGNKCKGEPANF